jgi:hypothetical protein
MHSIAGKPTYVIKPVITGPEPLIVRKGKDIVLECKGLAQKGVTFQVMWLKSRKLVCVLFIYLFIYSFPNLPLFKNNIKFCY